MRKQIIMEQMFRGINFLFALAAFTASIILSYLINLP